MNNFILESGNYNTKSPYQIILGTDIFLCQDIIQYNDKEKLHTY